MTRSFPEASPAATNGFVVGATLMGWLLVVVFFVAPTAVCYAKGRRGTANSGAVVIAAGVLVSEFTNTSAPYGHWSFVLVGTFAGVVLLASALEFARPDSVWARILYDDEKLRRARARQRRGFGTSSSKP